MTAEELLSQFNASASVRSIESSDKCIIDPETREISIPETYQLLGVESDEKVERIEFKSMIDESKAEQKKQETLFNKFSEE